MPAMFGSPSRNEAVGESAGYGGVEKRPLFVSCQGVLCTRAVAQKVK